MRKIWLTREQLIPKPFYKRKLFFFFIIVLIFAIIFIIYQFIFINQLNSDIKISNVVHHEKLVEIRQPTVVTKRMILGVRIRDLDNYQKKYHDQKFKCLTSLELISFDKVNDDYCDCKDGTDETFTNGCPNGKFYCTKQLRHKTGRGQDVFVPTSRINDKICDCSDCSDEFKTVNK